MVRPFGHPAVQSAWARCEATTAAANGGLRNAGVAALRRAYGGGEGDLAFEPLPRVIGLHSLLGSLPREDGTESMLSPQKSRAEPPVAFATACSLANTVGSKPRTELAGAAASTTRAAASMAGAVTATVTTRLLRTESAASTQLSASGGGAIPVASENAGHGSEDLLSRTRVVPPGLERRGRKSVRSSQPAAMGAPRRSINVQQLAGCTFELRTIRLLLRRRDLRCVGVQPIHALCVVCGAPGLGAVIQNGELACATDAQRHCVQFRRWWYRVSVPTVVAVC